MPYMPRLLDIGLIKQGGGIDYFINPQVRDMWPNDDINVTVNGENGSLNSTIFQSCADTVFTA
jgi:hypothetical protein